MALDQVHNFAHEAVTASIASGDTTISVNNASEFADPANGEYNVVVWDTSQGRPDEDTDVEVMRVTGYDTTNNTLTVTRGQEGTSDVSHPDTSEVMHAPTAKMFDDIESELRMRQANVPFTEIPDADNAIGLQKRIPSGMTLSIWEAGVTDSAENAPAGLDIVVRDVTNGVDVYSGNTMHAEGSPLASKAGQIGVQFRVENATGGPIDATGYVLYTME